jgi:hypothetical protein
VPDIVYEIDVGDSQALLVELVPYNVDFLGGEEDSEGVEEEVEGVGGHVAIGVLVVGVDI